MERNRRSAVTLNVSLVGSLPIVLLFFIGRHLEKQAFPFSHEEVVAVVAKCGVGEFVGDCTECKKCPVGEYDNGGCSFFKDTYCTWCEPLMHCPREELECSDRFDTTCRQCDCLDPIKGWGEVEVEYFRNHYRTLIGDGSNKAHIITQEDINANGVEDATFECYWNEDCRPCTVCTSDNPGLLRLDLEEGELADEQDINSPQDLLDLDGPGDYWQSVACSHEQDTQCEPCTICSNHEYTEKECSYFADAVCTACDYCQPGTWTHHECSASLVKEIGGDAECSDCSACGDDQWVSQRCWTYFHGDTQCKDCTLCDVGEVIEGYYRGGFYIGEPCVAGDIWGEGSDTVCTPCTDHPGVDAGYWESTRCAPDGEQDSVYSPCYVCTQQEWEEVPCQPSADTICQDCTPIDHCPRENTVCTDPNNQICACTDEEGCSSGHGCESPDFLGEQCCYMRTFTACGGLSYREFTARLAGFEGSGTEEFIDWCRAMCDDFEECMAFEVVDGGTVDDATGDAPLGLPNSVCHLKDVASLINEDTSKDCWHNICRQPEEDVNSQLLSDT